MAVQRINDEAIGDTAKDLAARLRRRILGERQEARPACPLDTGIREVDRHIKLLGRRMRQIGSYASGENTVEVLREIMDFPKPLAAAI